MTQTGVRETGGRRWRKEGDSWRRCSEAPPPQPALASPRGRLCSPRPPLWPGSFRGPRRRRSCAKEDARWVGGREPLWGPRKDPNPMHTAHEGGGLMCQLLSLSLSHTHTLSSTFTLTLKRSYSPYSSVHTCGHAHTRASTNAHTLAHTLGTPHFSQTHSHTPIHTPSATHITSHRLFNSHIHTSTHPNVHRALMLTTPIQAPKYLHSPRLHLTHIHTPHLFIHLLTHTCTSHIPSRICTHSHRHARSPPHSRTRFTRACARIDSQGPPDQHSACACAPATGRTLCPAWMPMCLEFGDCCWWKRLQVVGSRRSLRVASFSSEKLARERSRSRLREGGRHREGMGCRFPSVAAGALGRGRPAGSAYSPRLGSGLAGLRRQLLYLLTCGEEWLGTDLGQPLATQRQSQCSTPVTRGLSTESCGPRWKGGRGQR